MSLLTTIGLSLETVEELQSAVKDHMEDFNTEAGNLRSTVLDVIECMNESYPELETLCGALHRLFIIFDSIDVDSARDELEEIAQSLKDEEENEEKTRNTIKERMHMPNIAAFVAKIKAAQSDAELQQLCRDEIAAIYAQYPPATAHYNGDPENWTTV